MLLDADECFCPQAPAFASELVSTEGKLTEGDAGTSGAMRPSHCPSLKAKVCLSFFTYYIWLSKESLVFRASFKMQTHL